MSRTPLVTAVPSDHKNGGSLLLPLAVAALGAVCAWRLYRRCVVRVDEGCVTVVYETRRNSILSTSLDQDRSSSRDELPQISHFRPAMYVIASLLYTSRSVVVVPPTSFFNTFTLPASLLREEGDGEAVACRIDALRAADGALTLAITVRYRIPVEQLERYLAAVGPVPPNERIAVALADAARARGAELSVGLILNEERREAVFLQPLQEQLASRLMSEAGVKLLGVTVDWVEIAAKQEVV
ncbi:uncharacterized protein TM35_000062490 [Trypanosoma theileri]|uniref:Band 7 domain-containing protein n=1 Tax=Trypanosoma theileri TaxID=67003 RepID=A0A1X0P2T1_9TRYP|nr:uncharacterized protein TM35_000062490 [Trypanosoma theileri]ORC91244.1 hypothetical protein TM35_000062490 [Trypanosoma theileri]